ncbi:SMP-30/gluconolactonase/LRE family protein [Colwellia echini]|uniref:SMP-30/gluconolactonase/LRE family protein n=1 Tax=Colwellia echini TaxID=1982103 RepID=A0ABY3MYF6_9GAMM|nr:SMP-30/gluconolactonase/LRE family protein [Colwellia echini]TYK66260.1 SMP-30/gluconolactonase/LRE family protein [Colwellia echini]
MALTFNNIGLTQICQQNGTVPEGPIWSIKEQCLYWPDIVERTISRYCPAEGLIEQQTLDFEFSALAVNENNQLLVVGNCQLHVFNFAENHCTALTDKYNIGEANRFNDAKVDSYGRFWIGSLRKGLAEATGKIFSIDENLKIETHDRDYIASNGLGWSPDNQYFYMIETVSQQLFRYDFCQVSGKISNKTPFVDFNDQLGKPDGMCVDSEGNLWIAMWDGWGVLCYSNTGQLLGKVEVPMQKATCVTFGGENLSTLFITTANFGLTAQEKLEMPWAGSVLSCQPGVNGIATNIFKM